MLFLARQILVRLHHSADDVEDRVGVIARFENRFPLPEPNDRRDDREERAFFGTEGIPRVGSP